MFPFTWVGAAFAAGFLALAMAVFVALASLLSVPEGGRASILPGLVAGIRDWSVQAGARARRAVSPAGAEPGAAKPTDSVPVQPVRGRVR